MVAIVINVVVVTCRFMIGVESVSELPGPKPHFLCINVTLTLSRKLFGIVLILANCPTATGYSAYGGRCLKVYLDDVTYAIALRRCSTDGAHPYHYKSLAFDREPLRQLLDNSGGYSCYQRFLLQLITVLVFDQQQHCFYRRACCLKFTITPIAPETVLCTPWLPNGIYTHYVH